MLYGKEKGQDTSECKVVLIEQTKGHDTSECKVVLIGQTIAKLIKQKSIRRTIRKRSTKTGCIKTHMSQVTQILGIATLHVSGKLAFHRRHSEPTSLAIVDTCPVKCNSQFNKLCANVWGNISSYMYYDMILKGRV